MPKIIKVTDAATNHSGSPPVEIYIFVAGIFSIHRLPGHDATVIKGSFGHEHVVETPEQILALIAVDYRAGIDAARDQISDAALDLQAKKNLLGDEHSRWLLGPRLVAQYEAEISAAEK